MLGTLISNNWAQVLEACDCLKLLSIYFDHCVDATGVVIISLVFSALISMPKAVQALARRSTNFADDIDGVRIMPIQSKADEFHNFIFQFKDVTTQEPKALNFPHKYKGEKKGEKNPKDMLKWSRILGQNKPFRFARIHD